MSAGHGGQILVAGATAALSSRHDLVDLGMNRLRDLSAAEHLFQVRADGLRFEFPPLRTLDATPGNLRVQNTNLIGRTQEVKELVELVRLHRLVTLTGVGGVGKTRLGLQVAAEASGIFPDGVWLIELAPVVEPGVVGEAVATTLGVTVPAGQPVGASLAQALSGRRLLLMLDNCEHVLDQTAALVEAILAGTSTVHVLTTSREGLRVSAERLWPVPSLDVRAGTASPAVELFVDRAQAVNPAFDDHDGDTMAAVADICSRLDGIALAIELAAARMLAMSAQDLRDRLGGCRRSGCCDGSVAGVGARPGLGIMSCGAGCGPRWTKPGADQLAAKAGSMRKRRLRFSSAAVKRCCIKTLRVPR
jgi:hypothetical protein